MTNEMSETEDWGDVGGTKPKKGMPKWLWFCGGGCLIAAILCAVVAFIAVKAIKGMTDPEVFWPKVDELVAVDGPMPERFQPLSIVSLFGTEQYQFIDRDTSMTVQVFSPPASDEAKMKADLFSDDPSFPGMLLEGKGAGTMMVQGRELEYVDGIINLLAIKQRVHFLNATAEGGELVIISFQLQDPGNPIPQEDIIDILQPFHIGPDR